MILDNNTTQDRIALGLEIARDTIGATMGPGGQLVMYPGNSVYPTMTKDGATVARYLCEDKDKSVLNGIMLAISASVKQEKVHGDGTTLTAILCKTYWDAVKSSQYDLKTAISRIDADLDVFEDKIRNEYTKQIDNQDDLMRIALVSTNGDTELAEAITMSVWDTGLHGHIVAGISQQQGVTVKRTDGYVFNCGIQDREFINHSGVACMLEDVYYLITEKTISNISHIDHIVNELIKRSEGDPVNLVIIAPDIGYSMRTQIKSTFRADSPVRIAYIESSQLLPKKEKFTLEDLAAVTGAKIISDSTNTMKAYTAEVLGHSESFYSDTEKTIVYGTKGDTRDRLGALCEIMAESTDAYHVELAEASSGMIRGGLYEINIGGLSEAEVLERRDRANDAILACKSAIRGGFIVGGGIIPAALGVSGLFGSDFSTVMQYPMSLIISNAGINKDDHIQTVTESGVFDPTDVVIGAYRNSWSVIRNALRCTRMILQEK